MFKEDSTHILIVWRDELDRSMFHLDDQGGNGRCASSHSEGPGDSRRQRRVSAPVHVLDLIEGLRAKGFKTLLLPPVTPAAGRLVN